jgi:EAL domain-containing protein (putative c-di-GMP-specific phosphodiesterase class I)
LEKNLEITEELKAKETILAFKAKKELIDAQAKLNEIVNSLNPNSLKIYYQPKINVKTNECDKFESLIRYFHDGKITGPVFLDTLEKAGLAPVIDIWVCKEVKKDMEKWKKEGLNPEISVNLHPDTIKSKDAVKKVISILKDEKIAFEIIERSLLYGKIAEENIKEIRKAGFKISLDDFGVGYSSLETLAKINIEELKIDKSLIDIIDTPKGYNICKYVTKLCHKLDCEVVAEGVETEKQMKKVKEIDVDLIQGFIFSQALPLEKAIKFAKDFNSNDS